MKLWIDHSDGRYYATPLTDEEAADREAQGMDVGYLNDDAYAAFRRHCEQDAVWQEIFRAIDNELWVRRRERELQPLEEASREIARLKGDLAQAKRMWRYFESEWADAKGVRLGNHDRDEEWHCVYPQPGCDVGALEDEDWRASAEHLLSKYRADLGTLYQGCCCGHTHQKLSDDKISALRASGFLVVIESASEEV